VVANVWGLGTDLRWAVTERFGVQGELFAGQTLGTYMGGILQNTNATVFTGQPAEQGAGRDERRGDETGSRSQGVVSLSS
jgi:hypothetical protein